MAGGHNRRIAMKRQRIVRHLAIAGALALALTGASAAESGGAADGGKSSNESSDKPRCVHGCERWGKQCNVDPRGVYKCRRRCEKFGEICE